MEASDGKKSKLLKTWEYPKSSGIKIHEYINRQGTRYFGLSHRVVIPVKLTGNKRIYKQFAQKQDAQDWANEQYEGYQQNGFNFNELSNDERKEAALAWSLLRKQGISLIEAVNYAIPRMKPEGGNITIQKLIEEIMASKTRRFEQNQLRERSLKDFRTRAAKFVACFPEQKTSTVTTRQIKKWLLGLELSARSIKNYRMVLGEAFKYALQKKYITTNPMDGFSDEENKLINGKDELKEPDILTITEADRLLTSAQKTNNELELLPAIVIGLFCGIRTEELKRMEWSEIHLNNEQPFLSIPSTKAKKRRIRHVEIPKNAIQWLLPHNSKSGLLIPQKDKNDFDRKFKKLLTIANWNKTDKNGQKHSTWKRNSMRHSFGTYHFALYGDSMLTSRLMGHKSGDDVLFDHYRALTTKTQAEEYFSLLPPVSA